MIKRIAVCCIFVCLLIALPLALMGIKKVELSGPFMAFMKDTLRDLEKWKFEIPNIPQFQMQENSNFWEDLLNGLKVIGNLFIGIYNLAINIMNVVIYIIQFFVAIVKHLISLVGNLKEIGDTSYNPWPVI